MTIERICRIESIERQANVDHAAIRAGRDPSEDAPSAAAGEPRVVKA